jgi:hypothetical protein
MFTAKDYGIYVLINYSMHCMDDICFSLLLKGHILFVIGGGVTGDVQINDTDLYVPLKVKYRQLEMLDEPDKIPQPSRNYMIWMLCQSFEEVLDETDFIERFKSIWITNKLDSSTDYKVSTKLMDMVWKDLKEFRKELPQSPKNIKDLQNLIIQCTTKRCY